MRIVKGSLVALAFVSLHWNVALAQDGPVSPKGIKELLGWVGTSLGTTAGGARSALRLEPDATASVSAGSTNDTGTWRLWENGYCTTWKTIRAGQERCFTVTEPAPYSG